MPHDGGANVLALGLPGELFCKKVMHSVYYATVSFDCFVIAGYRYNMSESICTYIGENTLTILANKLN